SRYCLCKSSLNGQEKGTPCHRNGAARNRNGTNPLSLSDSSDHDATWSSELKTLAQSHFPPGLHPSMTYQPRDGTARGGAGGRIFAGVKLHARMPDICLVRRGCRTRRLARRNAIEPARAFGGEPGAGLALRNCESLKCFEIERDNAERIAGRDRLRLRAVEQVGLSEAQDSSDVGAIVQISEDRVVLPHRSEDAALGVGFRLETNGDCPDIKQELKFTGADQRRMVKVQPTGRSKRGMTGEGQLFLRGEDADTHALLAILRRISGGENEGGFGEVGFARDGLHLRVREAAAIMEHRQGIALERTLGEDVEDCVLQLAIHGVESTERLTSLLQGRTLKKAASGANCFHAGV